MNTPAYERETTTSRLRMWWLTGMQGYRIVRTSLAPKLGIFGRTALVKTWRLEGRQAMEATREKTK